MKEHRELCSIERRRHEGSHTHAHSTHTILHLTNWW